jgi:hypothetical protein
MRWLKNYFNLHSRGNWFLSFLILFFLTPWTYYPPLTPPCTPSLQKFKKFSNCCYVTHCHILWHNVIDTSKIITGFSLCSVFLCLCCSDWLIFPIVQKTSWPDCSTAIPEKTKQKRLNLSVFWYCFFVVLIKYSAVLTLPNFRGQQTQENPQENPLLLDHYPTLTIKSALAMVLWYHPCLISERSTVRFPSGCTKTFLSPLPLSPHRLTSYFDVWHHLPSAKIRKAQNNIVRVNIAPKKLTCSSRPRRGRRRSHYSLLERSG